MKKLIAIALAFVTTSVAGAQTYPARPVTVVVPYPDGYTVSIGHWNTHVVHGATLNLSFHVLNDFEPVALLADTPIWLVARKTLPPNDLKELIAWLRQNPGQATAGTVGVGGASDVTGVYFQNVTDTKFQFVPYRGSAPLNQDLTAGHIDLNLGMAAASYPLVRSGQIKAYAMIGSPTKVRKFRRRRSRRRRRWARTRRPRSKNGGRSSRRPASRPTEAEGFEGYGHAGACVPSGTVGRAQCGGVCVMTAA